jgi:hypothetical protein
LFCVNKTVYHSVNYFDAFMKPNQQIRPAFPAGNGGKSTRKEPSASAANSSRKLSRQLAEIKKSIVREFGTALGGQGRLLESALNEAEAVAWQTPYPHLIFPVLAQEKACAVSRWAAHQRSVRQASRQISLSA